MKGRLHRAAIALLPFTLLASCNASSQSVSSTEPFPNSAAASEALPAGDYCCISEQNNETTYARLSVSADNRVSGTLEHNFPAVGGDVSASKIEVSGRANGPELRLDREHFVEYDTVWTPTDSENGSSVWQATPTLLSVDDATEQSINTKRLSEADCASINTAFSDTTAANPSEESASTSPAPFASTLPVGVHCYIAEQGEYKTYADVSVKEDGSVDSTVVHKFPPLGDAYESRIDATGRANNTTLSLYTIPFTKYDTAWLPLLDQSKESVWTATPERLTVDAASSQRNNVTKFAAAECDDVRAAIYPLGGVYAGRPGSPASTLLTGYEGVRTRPVQFEAGRFNTTVSDAVPRGMADLYVLRAQANQTMSLDLSSNVNNAVFDVVDPDGNILSSSQTNAEVTLPGDGFYKVAVAGTEGNASYELYVGIK
ncbi:MAG: hypothetical protein AAF716_23130 [Cyanobacteria bacterium P01_D01_bin.1]